MRRLVSEMDYMSTLNLMAESMEVRNEKPYFNAPTRLQWLKNSLEANEKLDVRVEDEDADMNVTVSITLTVTGVDDKVIAKATGRSRAYTDVTRNDVTYDSRNYAYQNAYIGALDNALLLLGYSSEALMLELTGSNVLSQGELQAKILQASYAEKPLFPEDMPDLSGMKENTVFAAKPHAGAEDDMMGEAAAFKTEEIAKTEVAAREAEAKAEDETAAKEAEARAKAEAAAWEAEARAKTEAAAREAEAKAKAEAAAREAEVKAKAEAAAKEAEEKAKAAVKERTGVETEVVEAEAGDELTYEEALDYIIPPQGAIYAGKSFRCLLKEKGRMAVISFAGYFLKKTSESDPMYKVYQLLATH